MIEPKRPCMGSRRRIVSLIVFSMALLGPLRVDAEVEGPRKAAERHRCPEDSVCLAIQDFVATTSDARMDGVLGRAIPEVMHIALLSTPEIHVVTRSTLWRTLRESNAAMDEVTPERLFTAVNLKQSGANFLLTGRLIEIEGTVQLSGRIETLTRTEKWRQSVQGDVVPLDNIFSGVTSFTSAVVRSVADAGLLGYRVRNFLVTTFCDKSMDPTPRSRFYSKNLSEDLGRKADEIKTINARWLPSEEGECLSSEDVVSLALRERADAVVTGSIQMEANSLSVETKLYVPEHSVWLTIPVIEDLSKAYLEQKFTLLDQFGEFVAAVLDSEGNWNRDLLRSGRSLQALLAQAQESLRARKLDVASVILNEALNEFPNSAEVYQHLGTVRFQQGRFSDAVAMHEEAIRLKKDWPEAYLGLGNAYVKLRKFEAAEGAFNDLLQIEPNSVDAIDALGNVTMFQGRYEEAEIYFMKFAELEPESAKPYIRLSTLATSVGDRDEAIRWLENALVIDPANDTARRRLVALLIRRGLGEKWGEHPERAYADLDRSIQYAKSPSPDQYFERADCFALALSSQRITSEFGFAPSIEDYYLALELEKANPGSLRAAGATYVNLQELLIFSGRYDEAIQIGKEFLDSELAEAPKVGPRRKVIARFQNVVASILGNQPSYEQEFAEFEKLISGIDEMDLVWNFGMIERYIQQPDPTITDERRELVTILIDRLKEITG